MPTNSDYYYGFWQANPRLWERCRKQAAASMIAAGWKPYASKFNMVMQRKALKLWAKERMA